MSDITPLRNNLPQGVALGETGLTDDTAFPQNIEAEQQLLGAILTNNDIYDRISAIIRAEHFLPLVNFAPLLELCAFNRFSKLTV